MYESAEGLFYFSLLVAALLAFDLGFLHRRAHVIQFREALLGSAFWISLGLAFALLLYFTWPQQHPDYTPAKAAQQYLTGFLIELSLSIDNLFVFLLLINYFKVPREYEHKVLFWGILGAVLMRGAFIFLGVELIERFAFLIYIFGGFLIYTGFKLALSKEQNVDPERNPVLRMCRAAIPMTPNYVDGRFFVRVENLRRATPLFVVLVVINIMDVVFAVDSIPAIISITRHRFLIFSSNVFAILGLRSMYFALSGLVHLFHYLTRGLSLVLIFVGGKMLVHEAMHIDVPIEVTLGIVIAVLGGSIGASLLWPEKKSPVAEALDATPAELKHAEDQLRSATPAADGLSKEKIAAGGDAP